MTSLEFFPLLVFLEDLLRVVWDYPQKYDVVGETWCQMCDTLLGIIVSTLMVFVG